MNQPFTSSSNSGSGDMGGFEGRIVSASLHDNGAVNLETRPAPDMVEWALAEHYNGDILQHLGITSSQTRFKLCAKLLRIVLELHGKDIIHGSICAANVKGDSSVVTLANAGLSAEIQKQVDKVPLLPCTHYRSREELERDEYIPSKASDMYSLTLLFFAIFAGSDPYSPTPLIRVVSIIANHGHTGLKKPAMMPSALWSALDNYWKVDPEGREEAFERVRAALD